MFFTFSSFQKPLSSLGLSPLSSTFKAGKVTALWPRCGHVSLWPELGQVLRFSEPTWLSSPGCCGTEAWSILVVFGTRKLLPSISFVWGIWGGWTYARDYGFFGSWLPLTWENQQRLKDSISLRQHMETFPATSTAFHISTKTNYHFAFHRDTKNI